MRKNMLKIAIICMSIAVIVSIYGTCYSAGQPIAGQSFTHIENGHVWQLHFVVGAAPIGLVEFIADGEIMATKIYLAYEKNGQYFIVIPNIAVFQVVNENLYYPVIGMTFYLDK